MNGTQSRIRKSGRHTEGPIAKAIEKRSARLPSDTFLWLAAGSIVGALTLRALGRKDTSTFVGTWAPTLLIIGVYNKIVKLIGSENLSLEEARMEDEFDQDVA